MGVSAEHGQDTVQIVQQRHRDRDQHHFSRQERLANDPFLETRERQDAFLSEIKDTIRESLQTSGAGIGGLAALLQSVQPAPQQDEAMSEEAFDTAMDFISGL